VDVDVDVYVNGYVDVSGNTGVGGNGYVDVNVERWIRT